jgi:tRNA(His) guanylyltransferase
LRNIGDRIKNNYENRARYELTRRVPVIVRLDGKAFHTFTRGMTLPFDDTLIQGMVEAATAVAKEMQGFKAAYVQSDEASFFLTDYDSLHTDAWFGYNKSKVESISASVMTAAFNRKMQLDKDAYFDARSFNIPREEVVNYFLWRAKDWERNSLAMYCQANFSHKQLHGKDKAAQHEMLHSIGKNWTTDLTLEQRNGTWIFPQYITSDLLPEYESIAERLTPLINCDKIQEEFQSGPIDNTEN